MIRHVSLSSRPSDVDRAPILGGAQRALAADLAVLATFASVLAMFALSPITLESWGIAYLTSGGGVLSKLHPSTFAAMVALGLRCLAARDPLRAAWRIATGDPGVVLLVASVTVASVIAVVFAKTPVTPLIDTFILPALVFLLLRDLDPALIRWMAILLALLLLANAIIALIEFRGGWRLIKIDIPEGVSSDPTRADATFSWQAQFINEWRATALFGHPLVNGLIAGAFILCLVSQGSRWIPTWVSAPFAGIEFASMFAFGARTALVLTIILGGALLIQRLGTALGRGKRLDPRMVALGLIAVAVGLAGIGVLSETGFFDRMIDRFSTDSGSAAARVTMFDLFASIPLHDLLLVPDQDQVATLQRLFGLEFGIESSWLGLALNYGIIVTAGIVVGLFAFSRSVVRAAGSGAAAVLIFYFVLASAAATMSTKTTDFAMTICLILLFLPLGDRRGAARRPVRSDSMEPSWR